MSSSYSSLKFELIGTGEASGSWGDLTNTNIGTAIEQAIVGMATLDAGDFTANVATLTLTNTSAAQDARALCLVVSSGALSAAGTINVPAIQKPFIIINNDSYAVTVKVSGLTGVAVPAGKRTVVYNNGTDVGDQVTYLTNLTLGTALPVASGGTGATTASGARTNLGATTVGGNLVTLANPSAVTFVQINADNSITTMDAAAFRTAIGAGAGAGTVSSVGGTGTVSGITLTGTVTTSGNLTLGGTLAVTPSNFASQTANTILAAPNGSAGVPTFRALAAADVPTLNQSTNGTADNVTGVVAVANGGTNATSAGAALTSLGAQATLVSGTNIKTVNSTSLLGSGDIAISAAPAGSTTQIQYNNAGAFGASANLTFDGSKNLVIGATALGGTGVTVGSGAYAVSTSVAVGKSALASATASVGANSAFGASSLTAVTSGTNNTGVGALALSSATTSSESTAVGSGAMQLNTGGANTAAGVGALASGSGTFNAAFGYYAMVSAGSGTYNTGVGSYALDSFTSGSYNAGLGYLAGSNVTTGSGNLMLGPVNSSGTYAPVFDPTTQSDRVCAGSTAVTNAYVQVAWTVVSDARDKTELAPVPHGLDFVLQLKPTAYRYKPSREATEGHGPTRYGFLAQDVLALEGEAPVIVDADDLEKLRFNDQALIAVLVKAVQELKAEFDAYKAAHP